MNSRRVIFAFNSYIKQQSSLVCNLLQYNKNVNLQHLTVRTISTPSNLQSTINKIGFFPSHEPVIILQTNLKVAPALQPQIGLRSFHALTSKFQRELVFPSRNESTSTNSAEPKSKLSRKDMLKRAVKDYGSTVIVFHVGISLISLGSCYILVTSGMDMGKLLMPLGVSGSIATNTGTFVTAYAIHKVFAPVRISITLAATPFIVRYLRQIGFLKTPKV